MRADDRPEPPQTGPELEMLQGMLDFHRATLLWKVDELSEEELRRPMVPSGTSLLGLVKHLAYVERWWFPHRFAGEEVSFPWTDDDPDADFRIEEEETPEQILALYREQCERSRSVVAAAGSLDDLAKQAREPTALRWILIHMIEETARHNGHADILREQIDGATGE